MHIIKILKLEEETNLSIYDDDLNLLETESFIDLSTLNFFLQTLSKKYEIKKGLLIIYNRNKNTVDLIVARDENSFYIS
jgi:hypothetical protein